MHDRLIKVCGINDPNIAAAAVGLGVDMVGLMLDESSRRLIDIETAKRVSSVVLTSGGTPIVLSGSRNASETRALCNLLKTHWVQLIGQAAHGAGRDLPKKMRRLYTVHITKENSDMDQIIAALPGYDAKRDYILCDAPNPGSGERFDHTVFEAPSVPFFMAGGLNPDNVQSIVKQFQPNGVDVSSGVERSLNEKDLDLIELFVKRARK